MSGCINMRRSAEPRRRWLHQKAFRSFVATDPPAIITPHAATRSPSNAQDGNGTLAHALPRLESGSVMAPAEPITCTCKALKFGR